MRNPDLHYDTLSVNRDRHAYNMRAAAALATFFALAWGLLQWSLASGPHVAEGMARDFTLIEATVSLIVVGCALAHGAISGIAWLFASLRLRGAAQPVRRNARRFAVVG